MLRIPDTDFTSPIERETIILDAQAAARDTIIAGTSERITLDSIETTRPVVAAILSALRTDTATGQRGRRSILSAWLWAFNLQVSDIREAIDAVAARERELQAFRAALSA